MRITSWLHTFCRIKVLEGTQDASPSATLLYHSVWGPRHRTGRGFCCSFCSSAPGAPSQLCALPGPPAGLACFSKITLGSSRRRGLLPRRPGLCANPPKAELPQPGVLPRAGPRWPGCSSSDTDRLAPHPPPSGKQGEGSSAPKPFTCLFIIHSFVDSFSERLLAPFACRAHLWVASAAFPFVPESPLCVSEFLLLLESRGC